MLLARVRALRDGFEKMNAGNMRDVEERSELSNLTTSRRRKRTACVGYTRNGGRRRGVHRRRDHVADSKAVLTSLVEMETVPDDAW